MTSIVDFAVLNRQAAFKMHLSSSGMEFASEMVVKASLLNMSLIEIPTTLKPDGRDRGPHLNTWSDGWRHLKLLFRLCPSSRYNTPLILTSIIGVLTMLYLIPFNYEVTLLKTYSSWWIFSNGIILGVLNTLLYCYLTGNKTGSYQFKPNLTITEYNARPINTRYKLGA